MLKKKISVVSCLFFLCALTAYSDDRNLKDILSEFNNYRFGSVYVYDLEQGNAPELTEYFRDNFEKKNKKNTAEVKDEFAAIDKALLESVKQLAARIASESEFLERAEDIPGAITLGDATLKKIYAVARAPKAIDWGYRYYFVTSKPANPGELPGEIIGLIACYDAQGFEPSAGKMKQNLSRSADKLIVLGEDMKVTKIDEGKYGYPDLYKLSYSYFYQGAVNNRTMEARGIGVEGLRWLNETSGNAQPIAANGVVDSYTIQTYKRISEGNAYEIINKKNEVIVSPDLISWRSYKLNYKKDEFGVPVLNQIKQLRRKTDGSPELDENGNEIYDVVAEEMVIDTALGSNSYLPDLGFELKYGIDGLYYNSFTSERLSLNALWKNVSFGFILPTNGWTSAFADVYNLQRKFTYAGIGLNGSLDFPVNIIPQSDVFHLDFGYVFGDAQYPGYMPGMPSGDALLDFDETEFNEFQKENGENYLIRFNARLHYTFGIAVDESYLLRFGIGGSLYSAERWYNKMETDEEGNRRLSYFKDSIEAVGGLSGSISFLSKEATTPFGGTITYFDEALGLSGWVQIPVVDNTLYLKLEAGGYVIAFRKDPRPWETSGQFIPTARFVYTF